MLGGVTVNFILAYVIYVGMSFIYGDKDFTLDGFKDGYHIDEPLMNELGFKTGDKILQINGKTVKTDSEVRRSLITAESFTVQRAEEVKQINLPEDFLGQLTSRRVKSGLFKMRIPFIVAEVEDTLQNNGVDLIKGDVLLSINGESFKYFDQLESGLKPFKNQIVSATFLRDKNQINREIKISEDAKIGIYPLYFEKRFDELGYIDIIRKSYTFTESFGGGVDKFKEEVVGYFGQLGAIFNPKTGAYKGLGGFKAIFDIFPSFWSWEAFWKLTAFLSIMLAILNLLPIPALDGGHVMFLLYEMISGRKPSEKFLERAQVIGFFILIALVLFANGNDIFKAITN